MDADDLFAPGEVELVDEEFLAAVECPRCGHPDDRHDENGCDVCECPGP